MENTEQKLCECNFLGIKKAFFIRFLYLYTRNADCFYEMKISARYLLWL